MPQGNLRSARDLIELDLNVIQSRIGHEHRAAQLQQHGRFYDLYVSPKMPNTVAAIAKPASARPLLQHHLHRFATRTRASRSKPIEHALEDVADVSFHL